MSRELIRSSEFVRQRLAELQSSLSTLPEGEAPTWSIIEELEREPAESRMNEAILSQPLCTAIQIVSIDLLKAAGIRFKAVVGHSSGEIAAAYAAGYIRGFDAIRIAYYRGLTAKLASGPNGIKGSMMAVGTSEEDAYELCDLPMFEGRVGVAAVNSSSSITFSGDLDAIEEAHQVYLEEKKFARVLKVDTAYHSHHMEKSSPQYLQYLENCNIQVQEGDKSCTWFSSVKDGAPMSSTEDLTGTYWRDNMLKTVKFHQALSVAMKKGPYHLAIEVGPHAARKSNFQDFPIRL